jgi:hypothetical protein
MLRPWKTTPPTSLNSIWRDYGIALEISTRNATIVHKLRSAVDSTFECRGDAVIERLPDVLRHASRKRPSKCLSYVSFRNDAAFTTEALLEIHLHISTILQMPSSPQLLQASHWSRTRPSTDECPPSASTVLIALDFPSPTQ